ncbi:hypothetical protein SISSUDRAFT_1053447 [Sistotremastrum suecicum HHB10207 ss-3]|uniref:Uncharacterized protein n=1 Tax=Sistotremastrum suecicum HHB10207 ss-3 TaxID=1314776 RepID=A0A165Z7T8_9AGAM|nr:hypothetical protein SISSUDRAFT_1053447 [Sistotremastrum suecicum HHB10207 ss-3]
MLAVISTLYVLGNLLQLVSSQMARTGDTPCKGTSLDWYTSVLGITPCRTYEMLRQICDPTYIVGVMPTTTPPDLCDSQVSGCCCNSIAFALSMLCLNCQQGNGTGLQGDTGIDAGAGVYQEYLTQFGKAQCSPEVNQSLPIDIQSGVCNESIRIDDDLYNLFWEDGSWLYMDTKDTMMTNFVARKNNTFTHCDSSARLETRTIVGAVLAGVMGALLLIASMSYCYRRRRIVAQKLAAFPFYGFPVAREQSSGDTITSRGISFFSVLPGTKSPPPNIEERPRGTPLLMSTNSISPEAPIQDASNQIISGADGIVDVRGLFVETGAQSDRHHDAGPVIIHVQRSNSGRLPPAYGKLLRR